ncbi:MAG: cation:proton antiporter [Rhodobacteraceae bacterium]|nr:cation:proton antiporter [Paracoccaceae bacterium]
MEIAVAVSLIATLFVVVALSELASERLAVPFTVILAAMGILIGAGATFFWRTELTDALNPVALAILQFPIRASAFLYVFLPTLVFQVALSLNARRMLDDWVPILTLAVVAVAVATLMVGAALVPVSDLPLMACLLIGAIVSTTDPSAVVSVFRALPAPQRLARIVEGESLLNDAAAIALFGLFLGFVSRAAEDPELGPAIAAFPWLLLGGVGAGGLAGRAALELMARMPAHPLAQISVSVALPYLSYIGAERLLGVSGVVAVVAAGLTLNLLAPGRLRPATMAKLRDTWDLLAHWAGAFIFILAALFIPRLLERAEASDLLLIAVTVAAALAARVVILFGLLPLLSAARLSPKVERPYRVAILWGGLRGAVTLALALAVTENLTIDFEIRRQVGIVATGFTLYTLIVQGMTLRPLIRRLGLDRLSPIDAALGDQVVAVALQSVGDRVNEAARGLGLSAEVSEAEQAGIRKRLDAARQRADEGSEILDRDRITLGLVALAGRERELILDLFRRDIIEEELAQILLDRADRLAERTRVGGRGEYRAVARRNIERTRADQIAEWLHNRLGISGPLRRRTARRLEVLLAERMVLGELHGFIDSRISALYGARVSELLHELLERRMTEAAAALEALRQQFPNHTAEMERWLIRRTALQLEEREYEALTAEGLIGPELRASLAAEIAQRRAALARRPRLDLRVGRADLVRCFPFFADMEEPQLRHLARALRTVYVRPGRVLIPRGTQPRQVGFIVSGAVEAIPASGEPRRLGPGEMIGHFSLLSRSPAQAEVRAVIPTTLLVLDEARFLALLDRHEGLRAAILANAERRGLKLDLPAPGAARALRRAAAR